MNRNRETYCKSVIEAALRAAEIGYITEEDPHARGFTFHVPALALYLEVREYPTANSHARMLMVDNAVLVQGRIGAEIMARMIRGYSYGTAVSG